MFVSVQNTFQIYIHTIDISLLKIVKQNFLFLFGSAGRGAPDRKDGDGSGLDCGLSGCNSLQTKLRPPPCEDGLPGERRCSPTQEGQLGVNKGWVFLYVMRLIVLEFGKIAGKGSK